MIETFLTAFDPSDLPGSSIDPLGFERGYLFLADKILPGLTNVASYPRYFTLLCAGVHLSGEHADKSEREMISHRRETILRLERFWALANFMAQPEKANAIRGVTYVRDFVKVLEEQGATRTTANYTLLSRQSQYGAIGMYASVAEGLHFLNREDFVLTPALGEVAAEAFCEETEMPASLRRATLEDSDVSLASLAAWGERAHIQGEIKPREAKCLREAMHSNDVRTRVVEVLREHPVLNGSEVELDRVVRIVRTLRRTGKHDDLREAGECILAYEACYQLLQLALERMLWLCRHHSSASLTPAELAGDSVFTLVRSNLNRCTERLRAALDNGATPAFRENLDRLADVRRFVEAASGVTQDNLAFIDAIITRHADIQHGKFDGSRRKMPWLERDGTRITLTMTRAGGMDREATRPTAIRPHPYRLGAADALIAASGKGAKP